MATDVATIRSTRSDYDFLEGGITT